MMVHKHKVMSLPHDPDNRETWGRPGEGLMAHKKRKTMLGDANAISLGIKFLPLCIVKFKLALINISNNNFHGTFYMHFRKYLTCNMHLKRGQL